MIPRVTIVGGAGHRMPTPDTGDIDARIKSPVRITGEWKEQFSTPEVLNMMADVAAFVLDLWGEPIELDLGISDGTYTVIFRDGRPYKKLPFKRFDWEYCL